MMLIIIFIFITGFVLLLISFFIFLPTSLVKTLLKLGKSYKKGSFERDIIFFLLNAICKKHPIFIDFITKYFPFSLLYKGSLIHAENKSLRISIHNLEDYLRDRKMPILINSGNLNDKIPTLYAVPASRYKNKAQYLIKLQEELQKKYTSIYVRESKVGFRILVPHEIIN